MILVCQNRRIHRVCLRVALVEESCFGGLCANFSYYGSGDLYKSVDIDNVKEIIVEILSYSKCLHKAYGSIICGFYFSNTLAVLELAKFCSRYARVRHTCRRF